SPGPELRPTYWTSGRIDLLPSPAALERRGWFHSPLSHASLDALDHRLDHLDPRVALRVRLDQVPRRVRLVGAGDHVLHRLLVLGALLAVAPVLVSELPHLQRILGAPLEALELLLVRNVEPELDQDHSLVGER